MRKKAGVDTRSAEEDIKLKQIEQDSKEFLSYVCKSTLGT